MADEDAASCRSCLFRLRYGFRRALYDQLFLVRPSIHNPCNLTFCKMQVARYLLSFRLFWQSVCEYSTPEIISRVEGFNEVNEFA